MPPQHQLRTAEELGKEVRRIWIEWAQQQPNPKPSWLVPWEQLSEPDKEVDRRIGMALFTAGEASGIKKAADSIKEHRQVEYDYGKYRPCICSSCSERRSIKQAILALKPSDL